jgi:predicted metal-dependent HD superfamily phosphohydrolase
MDFPGARDYILHRLEKELDKKLIYHDFTHTLEVYESVVRLRKLEKLPEPIGMMLETAALYHDSGMLVAYRNHEENSVKIIREILPGFDYSNEEIEEIGRLILSTRLPQKPANREEAIICDSDMDNIGREDFFIQSFRLRLELEQFNQWVPLSVWFMEELQFMVNHRFHTASQVSLRKNQKTKNTEELKKIIGYFNSTISNQGN